MRNNELVYELFVNFYNINVIFFKNLYKIYEITLNFYKMTVRKIVLMVTINIHLSHQKK